MVQMMLREGAQVGVLCGSFAPGWKMRCIFTRVQLVCYIYLLWASEATG